MVQVAASAKLIFSSNHIELSVLMYDPKKIAFRFGTAGAATLFR